MKIKKELSGINETYVNTLQYATDKEYWRTVLQNKPEPVTLSGKLLIPSSSRDSIVHTTLIAKSVKVELQKIERMFGCDLKVLITAIGILYLHRYTGESDIIISAPIDQGLFKNRYEDVLQYRSIPLRFVLSSLQTLEKLIKQTVDILQVSANHQFFPLDTSNICGVCIEVNTDNINTAFNSISTVEHSLENQTLYDFTFLVENHQNSSDLRLVLTANSANYNAETLALHANRFLFLLGKSSQILKTPISSVNLLSEAEREIVLYDWNNTTWDFPKTYCIHELFELHVAKSPQDIALVFQDKRLSYAELNAKANQIARYLRTIGAGPGKVVGICVERSAEMVLGILATLKAGAAYVSFDPSYPSDRLNFMLSDSSPSALLTETATEKCISEIPYETPKINLSLDSAMWDHLPTGNIRKSVTGASELDIVYIIYTSGSTGMPKGVGINHLNLLNYASFILSQLPNDPRMKFASVSTIAADLGNTVVFPSLIGGGELHILSFETATNSNLFEIYMQQSEIDILKITPSHYKALFDSKKSAILVPRKALIFGGERLPSDLVDEIAELRPECKIYNHYGPTECTVGSIMSLIEKNRKYSANIPLGYPIGNANIYLLDVNDEPVSIGMVGEIYIGGIGVAGGYLNREDETKARFKPNPFVNDKNARMYKTGDLGRWLPNGMIEFLGRNDFQVKIRGFRVELGEIEGVLAQYPSIREAAVIAKLDGAIKPLVAYYTINQAVSIPELREHLLLALPNYMVPTIFVQLESMPLTANGKLDRNALPEPVIGEQGKELVKPTTDIENTLVNEWEAILDYFQPDVSQSFVQIGGDSLSFIRVSMILEKVLGCLPENWENMSIRELGKLKRSSPQTTSTINSTVLTRALCIVGVVLGHFNLLPVEGTTTVLFLLAGWSFSRFQISSIYHNQSIKPLLSTIFKIILPVLLFSLLIQLTHPPFQSESLLFVSNFLEPGLDRGYWFINVLVQIFVITLAMFSIKKIREFAFKNRFFFGMIATIVSLIVGLSINHYWDSAILYHRVPHLKIWLFFLGVSIAGIVSNGQKLFILLFLSIVYLYTSLIINLGLGLTPLAMILIVFVLFIEQLTIPKALGSFINNIAGASLFIYMTHFSFYHLFQSHTVAMDLLCSFVAIAGGVILWKIWEYVFLKCKLGLNLHAIYNKFYSLKN